MSTALICLIDAYTSLEFGVGWYVPSVYSFLRLSSPKVADFSCLAFSAEHKASVLKPLFNHFNEFTGGKSAENRGFKKPNDLDKIAAILTAT